MAPIVDELEQQYGEQVAIKRINADMGDGPKIMRDYRIPGHPTTLIFDQDGQEIERFIGPHSLETIADTLQKILNVEQ
jgi:thioredoxin-like negative regulator of GroEL